jgi:hypothetical protein
MLGLSGFERLLGRSKSFSAILAEGGELGRCLSLLVLSWHEQIF